MLSIAAVLLATGLSVSSIASAPPTEPPKTIVVDCSVDGALEQALARVAGSDRAEIHLRGVCTGGVVIATSGVTLRGITPDAAIVAPETADSVQTLVEVVNAQVSFRHLLLRGAELGVLASGKDAEVLLYDVELAESNLGIFGRDGAWIRILDSTVRDGEVGVLVQSDALLILQNATVTGHDTGVAVFFNSRAALTDTTVENNRTGGLQLEGRCSANILGGAFRENGQVHVYAGGRSDITLVSEVAMGSETDATPGALAVSDFSSISSYNTPVIYGDIRALDRGSLRIGNATVDGSVMVKIFSDAYVTNSEIQEGIFCQSGSNAVCSGTTTTPTVEGCPSPTCGGDPLRRRLEH